MRLRLALNVLVGFLIALVLLGLGLAAYWLPRLQQLGDEQLLASRVSEEASSLMVRVPTAIPPSEGSVNSGQREQVRRLGSLMVGAESEYSQRRGEVREVALAQARLMASLEWMDGQNVRNTSSSSALAAGGSGDRASAPTQVGAQLFRLAAQDLVLEINDWRGAVARDREQVLWTGPAWLGVLLTLALLAVAAMIWLMQRSVLQPLEGLRSQIRTIEEGTLDTPLEVSGASELRQLARRLSGMRDALLYSNRRLEGLNRNLHEEIRQRQLAEAALRDNNRDLESRVTRRTEDLARYATLLERRNLDLRRFTRVASHDMRTPLRAIASFSGILKGHLDQKLDPQARDWFERVERNTERLESLVDDLLSYSQFDSRDLQWVRLDMDKVLDESVSLLGDTVQASGASLQVQEGLPVVEADRTAMVNVFMNLISNALKFRSADAPIIAIRGERRESETCFMVEDNGIGIAPAFREQVFEPFKRLHAQHEIPGTGLGLAICRRILERHGGHIWVETSEFHGSRFCFVIPDRKPLHGG